MIEILDQDTTIGEGQKDKLKHNKEDIVDILSDIHSYEEGFNVFFDCIKGITIEPEWSEDLMRDCILERTRNINTSNIVLSCKDTTAAKERDVLLIPYNFYLKNKNFNILIFFFNFCKNDSNSFPNDF